MLPVHAPRVKVCGMTSPEDAAMCADLGASMLGFIFHPGSPRNVSPSLPAAMARVSTVTTVGVFVKQDAQETARILEAGGLDLAQLHGGQDEEFCEAVGPERVIKVVWPERYASKEELQAELDRFAPCCSWFLFDAGTSGGGHGTTLDLSFLDDLAIPRPWLLAGGLGPETIKAVLELRPENQPDAVDLNSGVESAPGVKSRDKLERTLEKIFACKNGD